MDTLDKIPTLDELPDVLVVEELKLVMRCGDNNAYALLNRKEFPVIKFGSKKVTPKESLKKWMTFEAEKENECLNCPKIRVLTQANFGNFKMISQITKQVKELENWLDSCDAPHSVRAVILSDIQVKKRALEVLHGRFKNTRAVI